MGGLFIKWNFISLLLLIRVSASFLYNRPVIVLTLGGLFILSGLFKDHFYVCLIHAEGVLLPDASFCLSVCPGRQLVLVQASI